MSEAIALMRKAGVVDKTGGPFGAVIGCDLTIGRFAMVGMGAVVTRSVAPFTSWSDSRRGPSPSCPGPENHCCGSRARRRRTVIC